MGAETAALLGDLELARSEAIRNGVPVVICSVADPAPTPATCSSSTNWQSGWIVFTDANGDGVHGATETILRQQQPFSGGASADTATASANLYAISFNRQGFPGLTAPAKFTIRDTPAHAALARCISISTVGYFHRDLGAGACP